MFLSIKDLFNQFMNYEYKWYIIGTIAFLIVLILIICIPSKKNKKEIKNNNERAIVESTEKTSDTIETISKEPIEEKKVEETVIVEPIKEVPINDKPITEEIVDSNNTEELVKKEAIESKTSDNKENTKYIGKWIIKKKGSEDFVLYLLASNGEIILTSESYMNIAGAKIGLLTLRKNITLGHFQIHNDKNGHFFFKLKDSANKLLGMGQIYPSKRSCQASINSVKKFSLKSELKNEVIEDMTYIEYIPKKMISVENIKDAYRGKWIIKRRELEYQAMLQASNGEILLVTENYASTTTVINAIEILRKNAEMNNFIIDCDKNKRYFYRLRNNVKLTLAIGEAYEKEASCINSIESVKRFCLTADIYEEIEE